MSHVSAQSLNAAEIMHMCANIAKKFSQLHSQGIIHCDIKTPNIHYDNSSREAVIIDFGTATEKGVVTSVKGTPPYMEKELRDRVYAIMLARSKIQAYDKSIAAINTKLADIGKEITNLEILFSVKPNESIKEELATLRDQEKGFQEKVEKQKNDVKILRQQYAERIPNLSVAEHTVQGDIHSLAITLAFKLELIEAIPAKNESAPHYAIYTGAARPNEPLKNYPALRVKAIELLSNMTSSDMNKIPSLDQVINFFNTLQVQLRDLPENRLQVGLLDMQEYSQANAEQKMQLLAALTNFSRIQLVASNNSYQEAYAKLIRKELEEYGLTVDANIITSIEKLAPLTAIMMDYATTAPLYQAYSLVSQQVFTPDEIVLLGNMPVITPAAVAPLVPPAYLPPQMDPADLGPYGRLIPPKTLHDINNKLRSGEIKLNRNQEATKISKKTLKLLGIDSPYSIIVKKENESLQIFAIYKGAKKGKTLGKGAFGQLKLVQDQHTGILYAEKTSKTSLETEANNLKMAGKLMASFTYEPKSEAGKEKYKPRRGEPVASAIIMELAQGIPLSSSSIQTLPPETLKTLSINFAKEIAALHQMNMVHADLKPENVFFNPANCKVTIIDFGNAIKSGEKMAPQGSKAFAASEIEEAATLGTSITYTDKTDVHSAAIIIAITLGLAKEIRVNGEIYSYKVADIQDAEYQNNAVIKNPGERAKLHELLTKATSKEQSQRPSMETIAKAIESVSLMSDHIITKEKTQTPNTASILRALSSGKNVSAKQAATEILQHKEADTKTQPEEPVAKAPKEKARSLTLDISPPPETPRFRGK